MNSNQQRQTPLLLEHVQEIGVQRVPDAQLSSQLPQPPIGRESGMQPEDLFGKFQNGPLLLPLLYIPLQPLLQPRLWRPLGALPHEILRHLLVAIADQQVGNRQQLIVVRQGALREGLFQPSGMHELADQVEDPVGAATDVEELRFRERCTGQFQEQSAQAPSGRAAVDLRQQTADPTGNGGEFCGGHAVADRAGHVEPQGDTALRQFEAVKIEQGMQDLQPRLRLVVH